MDVFEVREQLVNDYSAFTLSFVEPRDGRVKKLLEQRGRNERQRPQLWRSLNPNFTPGGFPDKIVLVESYDGGAGYATIIYDQGEWLDNLRAGTLTPRASSSPAGRDDNADLAGGGAER